VALCASIEWHLRPINEDVVEYCVRKHHWPRQLALDNSGAGKLAKGRNRFFTSPISSTEARQYYSNLEECNKFEKCLTRSSRKSGKGFSDQVLSKARGMYVQAPSFSLHDAYSYATSFASTRSTRVSRRETLESSVVVTHEGSATTLVSLRLCSHKCVE